MCEPSEIKLANISEAIDAFRRLRSDRTGYREQATICLRLASCGRQQPGFGQGSCNSLVVDTMIGVEVAISVQNRGYCHVRSNAAASPT